MTHTEALRDRLADKLKNTEFISHTHYAGLLFPTRQDSVDAVIDAILPIIESDRAALEAEAARLRGKLQTIVDGIPRPAAAETYRTDGRPSKHDKCKHGLFMYEDCGGCISDFALAALHPELNEKKEA